MNKCNYLIALPILLLGWGYIDFSFPNAIIVQRVGFLGMYTLITGVYIFPVLCFQYCIGLFARPMTHTIIGFFSGMMICLATVFYSIDYFIHDRLAIVLTLLFSVLFSVIGKSVSNHIVDQEWFDKDLWLYKLVSRYPPRRLSDMFPMIFYLLILFLFPLLLPFVHGVKV